MTDKEIIVLGVLEEIRREYDSFYLGFDAIMQRSGLDRETVRLACRSLAKQGLAEYRRGLWTEDGEMAGSGYGCTRKGADLVKSIAPEAA